MGSEAAALAKALGTGSPKLSRARGGAAPPAAAVAPRRRRRRKWPGCVAVLEVRNEADEPFELTADAADGGGSDGVGGGGGIPRVGCAAAPLPPRAPGGGSCYR